MLWEPRPRGELESPGGPGSHNGGRRAHRVSIHQEEGPSVEAFGLPPWSAVGGLRRTGRPSRFVPSWRPLLPVVVRLLWEGATPSHSRCPLYYNMRCQGFWAKSKEVPWFSWWQIRAKTGSSRPSLRAVDRYLCERACAAFGGSRRLVSKRADKRPVGMGVGQAGSLPVLARFKRALREGRALL